ncbi:MAG: hypothetical protein AABX11_02790 [Nanoarchaeota archaeon]
MKEVELRQIIKNRINFREVNANVMYNGFDMSGYNNSGFSNLEILAKFQDLMNLNCGTENRTPNLHLPIFWKGSGQIIKLDNSGKFEVIEELNGETTEDIIFKILKLQNTALLD